MERKKLKKIKLLKNRNKEIPEALAAESSKCSPKRPIVMILLNKTAIGKAIGIRVNAM